MSEDWRGRKTLADAELLVEAGMRDYGKPGAAAHDHWIDYLLEQGQKIADRLGDKDWSTRMRLTYAPNRFLPPAATATQLQLP